MAFPTAVGLKYGEEKITYSANQNNRALGTRGVLPDGRVFRWAQAAATAIAQYYLVQTKADAKASVHALAVGLDVGTVEVGKTTTTVTWATTATTADFYAQGYMTVGTSPGFGTYKVKSNVAATSGLTGQIVLEEDDKLRERFASGTTKVGFFQNPYTEVIISPATTLTGAIIGATPVYVTGSHYFWLQTWGPATLYCDSAPVAGMTLQTGLVSAGGAVATTTAADAALQGEGVVAWAPAAGAAADGNSYVFLTIGV